VRDTTQNLIGQYIINFIFKLSAYSILNDERMECNVFFAH